MNAYIYPSPNEKLVSGAAAFGMHILFVILIVFGVNWHNRVEPQANIVDLWPDLPKPAQPTEVIPPPRPPVEPKPRIAPPVKEVPKPEVLKPDIALKEKVEKERRAREEKQRELEKQLAAKKIEEAEKAAAAQQQALEAQRIREQQEAAQKLANERAAAQAKLLSDYKNRIASHIKRFIVLPPNLKGNPEAEFDVVLLPTGGVFDAKLKRSSGNAAYDSAVERAILKAQPLPLPPDPAIRELNLSFKPQQ